MRCLLNIQFNSSNYGTKINSQIIPEENINKNFSIKINIFIRILNWEIIMDYKNFEKVMQNLKIKRNDLVMLHTDPSNFTKEVWK